MSINKGVLEKIFEVVSEGDKLVKVITKVTKFEMKAPELEMSTSVDESPLDSVIEKGPVATDALHTRWA